MSDEWTPREPWPTVAEVREIVSAIIKHIAETPDWKPPPKVNP